MQPHASNIKLLPLLLQNDDKCGTSSDFWNLYEADIERAAKLNVKLFRLSVEWSRIQPRPGEVDIAAVQRYHQMFDVMDRWKTDRVDGLVLGCHNQACFTLQGANVCSFR